MLNMKVQTYTEFLFESKSTNYNEGDLVFCKNIGNSGLIGLLISKKLKDDDGEYFKVYLRGFGGDIENIYIEDFEPVTIKHTKSLFKEGDFSSYKSIAKDKGYVFNEEKYKSLKND